MALLRIDGFDHYATANIAMKWTPDFSSPTILPTSGRRGGGCGQFQYISNVYTVIPSAPTTIIVGFAIKFTGVGGLAYASTGKQFLSLSDEDTDQISLAVTSSGAIKVLRGATVLASSAFDVIFASTWHYVEIKALISNTVGTAEVHVNGATVINATGLDTQQSANAYVNRVNLGNGNINVAGYYDDLYICDTTGATNNDFLGDCRVDTLWPNADGTYTQFTPSTGTFHYQLVDDATPNTTDYVSDGNVGDRDSYQFQDLSVLASQEIYGVQVNSAVVKNDSGSKSVSNFVKSGATVLDSDPQVVTADSYHYYKDIYETDPNTSAAWTEAGINAAEFGVKVAA